MIEDTNPLPVWFRFPEPPREDDDREDAYCICCDAPTDGSDYCDTCTFGDCAIRVLSDALIAARTPDTKGGGRMETTLNGRALEWITGGDTGRSSKTIWAVMMGAVNERARAFEYSPPLDPSDFGRCYRLLALVPEWRPRLGEVAARFPEWRGLVEAWSELTTMYEAAMAAPRDRNGINAASRRMYDRMREIERALTATDTRTDHPNRAVQSHALD